MRASTVVAFLIAAAAGASAHAQDLPPLEGLQEEDEAEPGLWFRKPNVGYGPFRYVSMSLFPSLRSGFETNFPVAMASGAFDLRLAESWVKNASATDQWQVNYEVLRSNISFTWALSDDVRLELAIESASRTGGTLDAVILGFHNAFGLAAGYRNGLAKNANIIEIRPPGGGEPILVDENDPQPYEQAALLTFQHTITYGDDLWPAVSWSLSLRGNVASGDVQRSGPLDLGGSVGFVKELGGGVHLYLGGNAAWFGRESFFGLGLRTFGWSGTFGVEWAVGSNFSLVAQYLITSGGAESLSDFSQPSHEIVGGFKWEPWSGVQFELGVVENIVNFYNSPDFGIHLGATFRW